MKQFMKSLSYWLMLLSCMGVCGYAMFGYFAKQPGSTVHPEMRRVFIEHPWGIRLHVFGSAVALLLGPLQFHERTRKRLPALHKSTGYMYAVGGVLIGGTAGLWMSGFAFGGLVSQIGFAFLALLWLGSCTVAVRYAIKGDRKEHRRWMIRNFAMTFAAVTLRIQLGLFFALGLQFSEFYPVLAWSSWVPNLIAAELWLSIASRS